MTDGLLATADGELFRGISVGAEGVRTGEVVFNTSMTGYQEVLTDPSYASQIVVMTYPHIGNYGVVEADSQARRPAVCGLIVRSATDEPSNWRAEGRWSDFLQMHDVVALANVDTRRLTRHIRTAGAMPAAIGTDVSSIELREIAQQAPSMKGRDLTALVTCQTPYRLPGDEPRRGRVVALDYGLKRGIVTQLVTRGLDVHVLPAHSAAEDVYRSQPDGVFLSNGPGDPEPLEAHMAVVQELLGRLPVFGICLGHQILARALGAKTFKLPFGHHGGNHPVRKLSNGTIEITAQNHGFAVDLWDLAENRPPERTGVPGPELLPRAVGTSFGEVVPTHQNLNDGTLEGLRCLDVPAFSVQYHPEAAPGPHDASYLFGDFVELMGVEASA